MNKKGSVMIIIFLVVVVLSLLGGALFSRSISESKAAKNYLDSTQAFWLAEAGINRGVNELKSDSNWSGTESPVGLGAGEYSVSCAALESDQSKRIITSIGYVPSQDSSRARRTLKAVVSVGGASLFQWAVFADERAKFSGNAYVDSYNSTLGVYGDENVAENGDVGTNDDQVEIEGNAEIKGDVMTGRDLELPAIVIPEDLEDSGSLDVRNADIITLDAGIYKYSSIKVRTGGTLSANGEVTIYVTDSLDSQGSIIAFENKPANLVINITSANEEEDDEEEDNSKVKLSGKSTLYGAIYAPEARVHINGNDKDDSAKIYGAVMGNEVKMAGKAILHYDEDMNNAGAGEGQGVSFDSWTDTQNPYPLSVN